MSGEYYCIEEVVDPTIYYDDFESKNNKSNAMDRRNCLNSRENDAQSTSSRKSQDLRLYEIEEQLEIAENRCNTLKGQLDSMKRIYRRPDKADTPPIPKKAETSLVNKNDAAENNTFIPKSSRKRPNAPPPTSNKSRPSSPNKKRPVTSNLQESSDTLPQKSSSSSTAAPVANNEVVRPKQPFMAPLMRQNSSAIGTDHTGAAVKTINNILTGITDSVNRLSQLHSFEKKSKKSRKKRRDASNEASEGTVFTLPAVPFSPRLQKRIHDQQKKIEEIANVDLPGEKSAEDWNVRKFSVTSINSKAATAKLTKQSGLKNLTNKNKIQSSSGNVNLSKNAKSTAKHVENTTRLRPVRTSMVDEDPVVLSRKRKRAVKRLKPSSRLSLSRRFSDMNNQKRFEQFTTNNLVELYHNVAAKASDSEDSTNPSKSQINRQKGGGDLPVSADPAVPTLQEEAVQKKPVTKVFHSRLLTPINEHGFAEQENNFNKTECFSNATHNYELPTISSKMKQVTKSYLRQFNFRSIPFCAAKSTTPSHNIGINIQQVMSIIKTRQPITGISPTLAHNISLAAGKLQSRPLSVLVSTLSSRMGYSRASQCPLIKNPLNFNQLQEMAKEIPEEQFEDRENFVGDNGGATVEARDSFVRGACGDTEKTQEAPVWTIDPSTQQRCTCTFQKGVPFQEVLSKYQMSSDVCVNNKPTKTRITHKHTKSTLHPVYRKQRVRTWVRGETSNTHNATRKKSEHNSLTGKEKNLKTVLKNLHDEFDSLNTKYEELADQINKNNIDATEETLKELGEMELALNKKEEEINMVMSLYTEVVALKDQVKKLRERTSQPSIMISQNPSKSEYKEPKAALHLTQLLRQIQNYQMHYKGKV